MYKVEITYQPEKSNLPLQRKFYKEFVFDAGNMEQKEDFIIITGSIIREAMYEKENNDYFVQLATRDIGDLDEEAVRFFCGLAEKCRAAFKEKKMDGNPQ